MRREPQGWRPERGRPRARGPLRSPWRVRVGPDAAALPYHRGPSAASPLGGCARPASSRAGRGRGARGPEAVVAGPSSRARSPGTAPRPHVGGGGARLGWRVGAGGRPDSPRAAPSGARAAPGPAPPGRRSSSGPAALPGRYPTAPRPLTPPDLRQNSKVLGWPEEIILC